WRAEMKILQKGVTLIAVPLILQIVLVLWLVLQFARVEEQIAEAARSREIAATTHLLFFQSVEELLMSGVGEGVRSVGDIKSEQLQSGLEKLRTLAADDSSRSTLENKVEKAATALLNTSKQRQKEKQLALSSHKI